MVTICVAGGSCCSGGCKGAHNGWTHRKGSNWWSQVLGLYSVHYGNQVPSKHTTISALDQIKHESKLRWVKERGGRERRWKKEKREVRERIVCNGFKLNDAECDVALLQNLWIWLQEKSLKFLWYQVRGNVVRLSHARLEWRGCRSIQEDNLGFHKFYTHT